MIIHFSICFCFEEAAPEVGTAFFFWVELSIQFGRPCCGARWLKLFRPREESNPWNRTFERVCCTLGEETARTTEDASENEDLQSPELNVLVEQAHVEMVDQNMPRNY